MTGLLNWIGALLRPVGPQGNGEDAAVAPASDFFSDDYWADRSTAELEAALALTPHHVMVQSDDGAEALDSDLYFVIERALRRRRAQDLTAAREARLDAYLHRAEGGLPDHSLVVKDTDP